MLLGPTPEAFGPGGLWCTVGKPRCLLLPLQRVLRDEVAEAQRELRGEALLRAGRAEAPEELLRVLQGAEVVVAAMPKPRALITSTSGRLKALPLFSKCRALCSLLIL